MADPYSILGVSKGADDKAIKVAYRKLAKELHPDKNKDNPKASERFSEVTQAYDLLSDPKKRGQYDRGEIDENGQPRFAGNPFGGGSGYSQGGPAGGNFGSGGIDLGDYFDGLFGGGGGGRPGGGPGQRPQQAPPKGANIAYTHLVSFTDA
ncbi:DnaJ domain-containing protein, partial [Sphingorhabdus sp.]|uniref:DnaJ domain-containing protein n=1 Tax=Sphingorhabdus sp. TaxID=1902408 RepID=UPI0037C8825A